MRHHSPVLVDQAQLVSHELVRVAILWHELWHEGIEEASRYWFGQKNVDGMLATLQPLHDMMDAGPETTREVAFQQMFGRELQEAAEWTRKYTHPAGANSQSQSKTGSGSAASSQSTSAPVRGNTADLTKAWDIYSAVFRKVAKQLQEMRELELNEVSPKLLVAADMQLAVPGSYRVGQNSGYSGLGGYSGLASLHSHSLHTGSSGGFGSAAAAAAAAAAAINSSSANSVVRIAYFSPTLRVIESKQHPRRLTIGGSDGIEYPFLLKGKKSLSQYYWTALTLMLLLMCVICRSDFDFGILPPPPVIM